MKLPLIDINTIELLILRSAVADVLARGRRVYVGVAWGSADADIATVLLRDTRIFSSRLLPVHKPQKQPTRFCCCRRRCSSAGQVALVLAGGR
jgi:hypothetical protein